MSKEILLKQADTLLAEARRARRSSDGQPQPDRDRLVGQAEEMEGKAARLEREAISAKTTVADMFAGSLLAELASAAARPR